MKTVSYEQLITNAALWWDPILSVPVISYPNGYLERPLINQFEIGLTDWFLYDFEMPINGFIIPLEFICLL